MIDIKNVSKWYGTFQVLTDNTTAIKKGEVVVVCGPSGSGKSTLIKTVNALEPFYSLLPSAQRAADSPGGRSSPRCTSRARANSCCNSGSAMRARSSRSFSAGGSFPSR